MFKMARIRAFQHTAARRRLARPRQAGTAEAGFNTQPPEGGWRNRPPESAIRAGFNTQPPEGGWAATPAACGCHQAVSTHSRPKAAGCAGSQLSTRPWFQHTAARRRLGQHRRFGRRGRQFQHTAARRRLGSQRAAGRRVRRVSTHSRPKAAGIVLFGIITVFLCFNTQPPEGGWLGYLYGHYAVVVSTHSRPKAAGNACACEC